MQDQHLVIALILPLVKTIPATKVKVSVTLPAFQQVKLSSECCSADLLEYAGIFNKFLETSCPLFFGRLRSAM